MKSERRRQQSAWRARDSGPCCSTRGIYSARIPQASLAKSGSLSHSMGSLQHALALACLGRRFLHLRTDIEQAAGAGCVEVVQLHRQAVP